MTITIVIINPSWEMGLVCEWRHARKRWAENLVIFWKTRQLEAGCQRENSLQTEGFGPSVIHGWATLLRRERSAAMVRRTWGQYSSLSPSPAHLSQTRNITLSRIKCERYIFIKKCVRSFIENRHYVWLCSAYICICIYMRLYNRTIRQSSTLLTTLRI